jgi:hypothetical protein
MNMGWKSLLALGVFVVSFVLLSPVIPGLRDQPCACGGPSTKANMHAVELAVVDYAVQHDGRYPLTREALVAFMATNKVNLKNAYTGKPLEVVVRRADVAEGEKGAPGEVALCWTSDTTYVIRGCQKYGRWMEVRLTNAP